MKQQSIKKVDYKNNKQKVLFEANLRKVLMKIVV